VVSQLAFATNIDMSDLRMMRSDYVIDIHSGDANESLRPSYSALLILFGTPPVNEGDNIVVIGRVPADTPN